MDDEILENETEAKRSRDRVKKWRERMSREGGRPISIWLKADVAEMLLKLRRHYGRSKRGTIAPIVELAIRTLYQFTFKH